MAGAAVAGTTTAYAAEFEFKLHHFLGPKVPAHRLMLELWAQSIMEASGGRIASEKESGVGLERRHRRHGIQVGWAGAGGFTGGEAR